MTVNDVIGSVRDHYERSLGHLDRHATRYWLSPEGQSLIVGAAPNSPYDGVTTYFSLGLSAYEFRFPSLTRRGEVVVVLSRDYEFAKPLVFMICQQILAVGDAPVRGMVLRPADAQPLLPEIEMNSIYLTTPGLHPESFEEFTAATGDLVQIWMAIPIYGVEADWVRTSGPDAFENHLVAGNVDLTDLDRKPMALPERGPTS